MSSAAFQRALPDGFFLDARDLAGLEHFARDRGFIAPEQSIRSVTKAGDGNMNLTLRVTTDEGSLIFKQARPWVEKYPQIAAPADRSLVELAFYETAAERPALQAAMPRLLGSDTASRVLVLEDLGAAQDFTSLYAGATLGRDELEPLVTFLVALHESWTSPLPEVFTNRKMRALNHEHIFRLPLARDNAIALDEITPGLSDASETLKKDADYVDAVRRLGELYLADGNTLLHGDYFPGSWLRTADGIRVIDPEFCFAGPAAFDVGVMLGHLHLAAQAVADDLSEIYGADSETATLIPQFAGVEIMRRLIGVAQLPLRCDIDKKRELLELSRTLVLSA